MSTERLKRNMERIEQRMQPAKGKRKLTVIYDDNPNAAELEREALARARGDNVWIWDFITPRYGPDGSVIPHGTDSDRAAKTAG